MFDHSQFENIDPDENYFSECEASPSPYYTVQEFSSLISQGTPCLTFFNFNIRSFRMNSPMMLSLFPTPTAYPEVFILSETWFTEDYKDVINGYQGFHTVRVCESNRRSGGVSVFVREEFSAEILEFASYSNEDIEVCCVKTMLCNSQYVIVGIYRPIAGNIGKFFDELSNIINIDCIKNQTIVLTGDININLCIESPSCSRFMDLLYSYHFIPVITKPTRFSPNDLNNSSLLDHIWINKLVNYSSGVILADVTDHCPSFISLPICTNSNSQKASKVRISFRDECQVNTDHFSELLNNFNWSSIKSSDPSSYVQNFTEKLSELYNESFPIKIKYIANNKLFNPWMNNSLVKLIKAKSAYFSLYRHGLITKSENNSFKNKVKRIIDRARITYYKNLFDRNKGNIRSTWRIIKSLTSQNSAADKISKINWHGSSSDDEQQIANIFSQYFSGIAAELENDLPTTNFDPFFYVKPIAPSMYLQPVTPTECSKIISNLKNSVHSINPIPIRLLKLNKQFLCTTISDIINQCFQSGTFPSCLKLAMITPIHKSGSKSDPSNYRPISVTSFMCKILEKAILSRLINFMSFNSVLSSKQFGFIKGKSTTDAIVSLTEYLYDSLNSKDISIAIFIDYRKAFDTINHKILLRKLELYGVRGLPLQLLKGFLSDRQLAVKVGGSISPRTILNIGIPQGTVLGPILFLLYINDLPNISANCNSILFADDSTLVFKHNDIQTLTQTCNSELVKFHVWSLANRLSINYSKTCCLLVTNIVLQSEPLIYLNGNTLDFKSSVRYLGVTIDASLKFDLHITSVCKKISKSIGILYKLKDVLPFTCLKTLYYSFIYPYILYGLIVWGGTNQVHLQPLIVLQKRCIRLVCNAPYLAHSEPLFLMSNVLKFSDVYRFEIANYVFCSQSNPDFHRTHTYTTRNRELLLPPFQRLTQTQKSVNFKGIQVWNSLPLDLRTTERIAVFKRKLKSYLFSFYAREQ